MAQCGSAWLDAVRAFVIMADIVMYSAVIIYTVGFFWQDDKVGIKLRWLAAILIIASGTSKLTSGILCKTVKKVKFYPNVSPGAKCAIHIAKSSNGSQNVY